MVMSAPDLFSNCYYGKRDLYAAALLSEELIGHAVKCFLDVNCVSFSTGAVIALIAPPFVVDKSLKFRGSHSLNLLGTGLHTSSSVLMCSFCKTAEMKLILVLFLNGLNSPSRIVLSSVILCCRWVLWACTNS